ncbi:hypothetical protein [Actibacterium ureilyticum]|uniref:hypothetical protein n=1 Tax=Actibacterium ureilyticum TaxID=1590614 RepID=UPI001FE7DA09|nr:hypothetical protein [Actibacterium ureilyticum]
MLVKRFAAVLAVLGVLFVAGCGAPGRDVPVTRADIDALATAITGMGAGVDPVEATRAAEIAFTHTKVLAAEYEITDPPLIHNMKVNQGLRPRGLCWHWAEDMQARLAQEGFQTLSLHRAIANADNPFRIDHSTVIVSARGDAFTDGIVLDPWREGGQLHWTPTLQDDSYTWVHRQEVFADRRAQMARKGLAP